MTTFYAQPYDINACGFFFNTATQYEAKSAAARNATGQPVEEFEIQFIDGDLIDAALFNALSVHQGSIAAFLDATEDWTHGQKVSVIIATAEAGYSFDLGRDDPDRFDIDLYEIESLRELAMRFVDDGLFGTIPDAIASYLDYDAIARDLGMDYAMTEIDGTDYAYRFG